MIRELPSACDVVVIGAGHNGLIAANYLSRAGLEVVLLEARSDVGGCSASESFGGGVVNICNCDHITFRTTPVHDELDLAAHGLRYLDAEPSQLNLSWDGGPAWSVWKSVDDTVDELRRTYPHEADNYRRYARAALPIARLVLDAAAAGPWRGSLVRTVVSRGGRGVRRLLQWSSMSAADVMRSFFRDERVFAPALATGPVVWGLSPELPGTGLGALTFAFRHVAQVGRPVGGSGALATALSSALSSGGGRLVTSTRVDTILVENDGPSAFARRMATWFTPAPSCRRPTRGAPCSNGSSTFHAPPDPPSSAGVRNLISPDTRARSTPSSLTCPCTRACRRRTGRR